MAFLDLMSPSKRMTFGFDAEKALRIPIGAASPLWLAFAGVATAGVGFWWMSRLLKPIADLALKTPPAAPMARLAAPEPTSEPGAGAAPEPTADPIAGMAAVDPVVAAMEAMPEPAMAEPIVEAVMEAAAEPVAMVAAVVEAPPEVSFPIADALLAGVDAIPDPVEEPAPAPMAEAAPESAAPVTPKTIAARRKAPARRVSAGPAPKRPKPSR